LDCVFRRRPSRLSLAGGLVLLLAVSGCGKSRLVSVEGTVTLDGEPLAGATVVFQPVGEGQPATAQTDSDGNFQLVTLKGDKGALPGEYKVLVSKGEEMQFSGGEPPDPGQMGKMMRARDRKKQITLQPKKGVVPTKYANSATTPFQKETVPPKGKIVLELQSK
jgi:hypothetical protein